MRNEEIKNQEESSVANSTNEVKTEVHTVEEKKVDKSKKENVKNNKNKKNNKAKDKGPGKMAKTMSELKKVTWPSFKDVVKQTSVVLVVVLVFLVVIFGLDKLCSWLIGLICS